MTAPNPAAATTPAGSIYDLGYQHYEGKRHGRWYAAWSLYVESLRSVWGFGRPVTAKAAPFIIVGLYSFLALIQLAFSSFIAESVRTGNQADLYTYGNYFALLSPLIVLFCVAQAPEVVCRDQRYQVLPLYLTRALSALDYALAKMAAFATALFIALMVPMIALFVGDLLMKADAFKAIGDELPKALPAIPACLLTALSLAAISLALSSFSPRRAYSAIGLVAYLLLIEAVITAVYSVGQRTDWTWTNYIKLAGPTSALSGATSWFFGQPLDPIHWPAAATSGDYLLAAMISVVIFTSILLARYLRVKA
jgi:ABC-2 type transport system permease protein